MRQRVAALEQSEAERNEAERKLRDSEQRFQKLFESMSTGFALHEVILDEAGRPSDYRFLDVNPAFEQLTGWKGADLAGKTVVEAMPEAKAFWFDIYGRVAATGEAFHFENYSDKLDKYLEVTVYGPEPGRYASIFQDITERKRAEDKLRRYSSELEAANRTKSDFLSSMSHELRTPMNAIIGFSEVLLGNYYGELNEKQLAYVTDILASGKHLLSLINNILELSKVGAGEVQLRLSRVDLEDVLRNSLPMIQKMVMGRGISLEVNLPDSLKGMKIYADERMLKQIMANILSNAAKFTGDGGRIEVAARLVTEPNNNLKLQEEGKSLLEISVSDTGVGIRAEDQARIFEPFEQIKGGMTDKTPGTGMGLALTKDFVALQGGRIWVESEGLGKGSQFYILLPVHTNFQSAF